MDILEMVSTPQTKQPNGRKVWSIDLETVWLPLFTATNAIGKTAIPADCLGAPLRLAYEKDGTVRFTESGRPVIRVAKELSQTVALTRGNFTASLIAKTNEIRTANLDLYKAQVEANYKAGQPIIKRDSDKLTSAILARMMADKPAEVVKPADVVKPARPKAKAKAKPPARKPADVTPPADNGDGATPTPAKRELVTATA